MIRLLLRLFGIKDYEVCQSCETLKQQLAYERSDKQKLTDTLLDLVKPKPVTIPESVELESIKGISTFSRRRAVLEEEDRKNASVIANSKNLAMPDDVLRIKNRPFNYVTPPVKTTEELEEEVGLQQKEIKQNG